MPKKQDIVRALTVTEQNDVIIYTSKDGKSNVALMTREGKVWLTQKQMAQLFATSSQNIGQHIAKVLNDRELDQNSVGKYFFITADDGKPYNTLCYSLDMILAVGYKVRGGLYMSNLIDGAN